ncbi:ATP-dependent DNA helicase Q4-like [Haliotis rufescens]|uniref:ATP-dependent DNA helicase Q4-like n=1 Tax=Haliotis rufescens TaxID=6454 RepID=UPI00201E96E2|nr:ATP-dependent DNA helicase Q4-like [Haliotis rufescens]
MSDVTELKKTLKKWEVTFYKTHSRKPSKTDIDDAPQEIRDAYKNYANLRKGNSSSSDSKKPADGRNTDNRLNTSRETTPDTSQSPQILSAFEHVTSNNSVTIQSADVKDRSADVQDGSADVKDGSADVKDRSADVKDGSADVKDGSADVKDRSADVKDGSADVKDRSDDERETVSDMDKSNLDEVWGVSFNKGIAEGSKKQKKVTKQHQSQKLLDKLGSKLFQNSQKFSSAGKKVDPQKASWRWKPSGSENTDEKVVSSPAGPEDEPSTPFEDVGGDLEPASVRQYKYSTGSDFKHGSDKQSERAMDEIDGDIAMPFTNKVKNSIFSPTPKLPKNRYSTKSFPDNVDVPGHLTLTARKKFSVSAFKPKELKNPFPEDGSDSFSNINTVKGDNLSNKNTVKGDNSTLPTQTRTVMEVDESMFEQEFAENFEMPSFVASNDNARNTTTSVSREKYTSFMGGFGEDESSPSTSVVSRAAVTDTYDAGEVSDDGSDDGDPMDKKTKKRKQKSGSTSRKRLKANDGSSCTAGDAPEDQEEDGEVVKKSKPKAPPRKATASRVSSGNFVRLNMKVKKYRRKDGRHMTGGQYKRNQWKQKMQARSKSYGDKCFVCNGTGHWSRDCPQKNSGSKKVVEEIDESDFPSIQEAALLAQGVRTPAASSTVARPSQTEGHEDTQTGGMQDTQTDTQPMNEDPMMDVEMSIVRSRREVVEPPKSVEPLLTLQPNGEVTETSDIPDLKTGLKKFGFKQFRPGQEETIKRILSGLSTLVVLSTGGGKSLCYQLPAYIYGQRSRCLTLVVSPLVSLMEDQVTGLPPGVRGACLHANMTPAQRDGIIAAVNDGSVHFLLMSPEAIVGGGGTTKGAFPPPDKLPPIPFVCIDEAHCLSEWSHNFRPSYLRLCKVLRERYGVKCFLGLTATATKSTAQDVARHLGIEDVEKATVRGLPIPKNLVLSVSQDENRDEALVQLLQGERFRDCHSIIIYCTRRELTNRVATLLRTCLKEQEVDLNQAAEQPKGKGKKKKFSVAESYHAGHTPAQRKRVQKNFMSGQLRIVVATVAFGMGLDKSDVRAVIHYNMPKSFEGYVQEIGRAGRDGQTSHCHLFLDPEGKDLSELKRHTYGNTVDRFALKKLVQQIFRKCRCRDIHQSHQNTQTDEDLNQKENVTLPSRICPGHERALPIDRTVTDLDIREEGIGTLLCYLELVPENCLENLQPVYATCKVLCYGGPPQLQAVSKKCPPVAVAIARQKMEGKSFSNANSVEFPIVEVSDTMGWDSGPVKREVKLLQWNWAGQGAQITSKSGVLVEFSELAFHLRSPGDLNQEEMDNIVDFLHKRVTRQEGTELYQLNLLYNSLRSCAHKSYWMCADEANINKSDKLRQLMENFFEDKKSALSRMEEEESESDQILCPRDLDQVIVDARQFITLYGQEHNLTGRSIARVFHGIGSPCFPIATWCRVRRFWRSHLHVNFNVCLKAATRELVRMR